MVGPKGCSEFNTTHNHRKSSVLERNSVLAGVLLGPGLPFAPPLGPQGKPPHGSLCVPLSEWVWVQGKPTWQQGKDILREDFRVVEITKQNQKHDTIPPPPGSESLLAEGCLIRSMRSNPGGRSHPHAGETLHLSLHAWAQGTVSWTWGASRHSPLPEAS